MAGIIDGKKWTEQRLEHLRGLLAAGPTDDQRAAIEAEIRDLEAEQKTSQSRFRRWLLFGGRLPG